MNVNKICKVCIMDISDPEIIFKNDICNHCIRFENIKHQRLNTGPDSKEVFNKLIKDIKQNGKKHK